MQRHKESNAVKDERGQRRCICCPVHFPFKTVDNRAHNHVKYILQPRRSTLEPLAKAVEKSKNNLCQDSSTANCRAARASAVSDVSNSSVRESCSSFMVDPSPQGMMP